MYAKGLGVSQDDREAVKWYRKAAEQGDALAQYNLGGMYDEGQGVPQNDGEAAKWYLRAAEQGIANAQYNLALMYHDGLGVPLDYVQAFKWFDIAARGGDENAASGREFVARKMTSAQVAEAQRLAREWRQKPGAQLNQSSPASTRTRTDNETTQY